MSSSVITGNTSGIATASTPGLYKAGQAPGTTSGTAIAAGYIGEQIQSRVSTFTNISTNAGAALTSITLTAGTWDITGVATYKLNTGTSLTAIALTIATTSADIAGQSKALNWSDSAAVPTAGADSTITVSNYRVNISSSTTFYLNGQINGGGTPQFMCRLSAVRVG